MRAKKYFLMSAVFGVIAGGMAFAQSDYKCFGTPVNACATQCGCPTKVKEDFCSESRPLPNTGSVTYYYCMASVSNTCTPNVRSCGGLVYLCACCDCYNCAAPCFGGDPLKKDPEDPCVCTLTTKVGKCLNNYGCL